MPKHKLLPFSVEGGAQPADINNAWPTDVDPSEVVGTGAFMLREYVPGQVVRLVRNPNYWKFDEAGTRLPYLDALNYLIVPGTDAQVAQFLAGNLDQLNISGAQFPDFKSRELAGAAFRVEPRAPCSARRRTWRSTSTPPTPSSPACSPTTPSARRWSTRSTACA
jgi:peptide/nickel transport system substrate-binding protein